MSSVTADFALDTRGLPLDLTMGFEKGHRALPDDCGWRWKDLKHGGSGAVGCPGKTTFTGGPFGMLESSPMPPPYRSKARARV